MINHAQAVIVSLTTTRDRLHLLKFALLSLVEQSMKPDRIVVWVSADPYLRDHGVSSDDFDYIVDEWLPKNGKELVEFRFCENTGPYRKLLPALKSFNENDLVVTADDDIIYGSKWLEELFECYNHNDGDGVVCARVRKIRKNYFGVRQSYICWRVIYGSEVLVSNYVATFGAGAIVRVGLIKNENVVLDDYKLISPTADDLWFSRLLINEGVKVYTAPKVISQLHFIHHDDGLVNYNLPKKAYYLGRFWNVLVVPLIAKLGISTCKNDHYFKSIERFFKVE